MEPRASEAGHNHRLVKAELERRKSVPDQVESSTEDPSNGKSAPSAADTLSESGVVDRNRAVQIIHSVREGRSRGSYGGGDDAEHPW